MEMSELNSGYPDVAQTDGVMIHTRGSSATGHSNDTGTSNNKAQESPMSTKLHYSDSGPHREMAVDCPANFVGVKKEPPRLPRPLSNIIQTGSLSSIAKDSHTTTVTPSRSSQASAVQEVDVGTSSKVPFTRDEHDRSERLRRYQEELAKRREMEDRINQEQEQLRASLRGSKKMQGLEEKRAKAQMLETRDGFDNPNYCGDDIGDRARLQKTTPMSKSQSQQQGITDGHISEQITTQEILTSVQQAKHYLHDAQDKVDLGRVLHFVVNERFQRVLQLHNKLVSTTMQVPVGHDESSTVTLLCDEVQQSANSSKSHKKYTNELVKILDETHFKSLVSAYDQCVQHDTFPAKSVEDKDERQYLYERASQYGDENIKIVRLQKTADPLGATVKNEGEAVVISRIVKGGVAEKSGLLHEGDEILEINGVGIRGMSINDVCDLMSRLSGVLTFLINPGLEHGPKAGTDSVTHVRALFSYDPEEDNLIPCRELGFMFRKGDILHVINESDLNWWQAYREGEDDQMLAGLIPSRHFYETREKLRLVAFGQRKDKAGRKFRCHCRKKKSKYRADEEDNDAEKVLSYEDVALYYPQPNRKRPIILIGPPNVGRQELRQRLLESDPDRFAAAVPHTSRQIHDGEHNGREYHFVSKQDFETAVAGGQFVEYGEYEKQFFGTSMGSIREIVNSGKVCILNLHPQSMQILKKSDLRPYFIFIAPCSIAKFKQMRQQQGVTVTDEELQTIIDKAREMENLHGHFFDIVIVNQDLDHAYEELLAEINRLEVEPQWVPTSWIN